jgi:3-oxoacyl-[acyl-carrier protein] reductase
MTETRTAVVTGGSGAIGGAICRRLASDGYFVFVCGNQGIDRANSVVEEIRAAGGDARPLMFDVADSSAAERSLAEVAADSRAVGAVVHAAGLGQRSLMLQTPAPTVEAVIAANLSGFFFSVRPLLRKMMRLRGGSVVAVGSIAGDSGLDGCSAYSASKAGLVGAVRSLAREAGAYNIRANVVSPGWIAAGMNQSDPPDHVMNRIPLRRSGCVQDVASVVSFLCSDEASYVTGAVIPVSGGLDM